MQNIVGSCDVKFPIRLEGIAYSHGYFATYEPELFPGLIYRMKQPKIVLLIFVSGKVVLTGGWVLLTGAFIESALQGGGGSGLEGRRGGWFERRGRTDQAGGLEQESCVCNWQMCDTQKAACLSSMGRRVSGLRRCCWGCMHTIVALAPMGTCTPLRRCQAARGDL